MERLTERIDGWVMRKGCHGPCRTCNGAECADIYPIIDRLAAYEDTGLEPDEIRRFLQTGTGGLYKKLPCKEGAPVWWIDVDWLPGNGPMFHKISSGKFRYAMLDWNNPVYTSQADAEAALAKMAKEGTTSEKSDRY